MDQEQTRAPSRASEQRLVGEDEFAQLLGVSRRTLKDLRASGLVPEPLSLGPRLPRWHIPHDIEDTVRRLERRERRAEPGDLAAARRAHIEKLKAGGAPAGAAQ